MSKETLQEVLEDTDKLVKKMFLQDNTGEMPYILCRRNFVKKPQGARGIKKEGGHLITDYRWEGWRRRVHNGQVEFEIDQNFVLYVHPNGNCLIPRTDNNEKFLEKLKTPDFRTKRKRVKITLEAGEQKRKEEIYYDPPEYEEIHQKTSDTLVDTLYEKILAKFKGKLDISDRDVQAAIGKEVESFGKDEEEMDPEELERLAKRAESNDLSNPEKIQKTKQVVRPRGRPKKVNADQ